MLYSVQPGGQSPADRGLLSDLWGPGLSADPHDTDLPPALIPAPGDRVLVKHRYSAFHGTALADTPSDGVADFSAEDHHMALHYVARRCGRVLSIVELQKTLGSTTRRPALTA